MRKDVEFDEILKAGRLNALLKNRFGLKLVHTQNVPSAYFGVWNRAWWLVWEECANEKEDMYWFNRDPFNLRGVAWIMGKKDKTQNRLIELGIWPSVSSFRRSLVNSISGFIEKSGARDTFSTPAWVRNPFLGTSFEELNVHIDLGG